MKKTIRYSDADLLTGLISRNDVILREYYNLFFTSVRRFVLYNNGNEEDAKDIFQDVLLAMFQKVRNEDFRLTCALRTFIYSIARFMWLKELEKRKRLVRKTVDFDAFLDPGADILEWGDYNERLMLYRSIFEKLSTDCKKILTLFMEGLPVADITRKMGYKSDQHTKNRRYRCKMSLINRIRIAFGYKELVYENNTENRGIPGWYAKR